MNKLCIFVALIAVASAGNPSDAHASTRNIKDSPNAGDGSYSYSFDTSNGISQQQSGVGGQSAQGSANWISPDGQPISISYIADQFGYRAAGSAIPTPPPVPAAIARALAYIAAHPSQESQPTFQRTVQPAFRFNTQRFF